MSPLFRKKVSRGALQASNGAVQSIAVGLQTLILRSPIRMAHFVESTPEFDLGGRFVDLRKDEDRFH